MKIRTHFICLPILLVFSVHTGLAQNPRDLTLSAQSAIAFTLTPDSLQNGKSVELSKLNWKYQPGDDPRFADPQFDDHSWETLKGAAITLANIPQSGWRGIGWFRLRLQVDPALTAQPLALVMAHYGASEVYLDGKLAQRFGAVGTTPDTEVAYNPNTLPVNIALDARGEHVLAVRHSCMEMRDMSAGWGKWIARQSARPVVSAYANRTNNYGAGFGVWVVEASQARDDQGAKRTGGGLYLLNFGLLLAIGLLHLLLFWFYPRQRANLFFGLFACSSAASNIIYYRWSLSHQSATGILLQNGANNTLSFLAWGTLLAFMYTAFAERIPKWFWLWVMAAALYIPMNLFFVGLAETRHWYWYIQALTWFPVIEVARGMSKPIKNKVPGAWIVGAGMLAYTLHMALIVLILVRGASGADFSITSRNVVILFLTGAVSVFLARRFARVSLDLEAQLAQVKQLSEKELEYQRAEAELRVQHAQEKAENERRARELEEARQLQLSMLPGQVPQLPHLEIAAYMKTASEVGGDYYDFHLGEDGTLTVAVGDATGHGLKAGTMVSSVKSLFISLADHPDIPYIFHRMSRVLKEMKLRGLFMAMTMVKVKGDQLTVSITGMPPLLIYRAASGDVEEITLRAIPLGGLTSYQYKQQKLPIAPGDVIVLMSDGLPERFNAENEMLDYPATKRALAAVANHSPREIIEHFVSLGDEWSNGRPQDDDVTFVVLKVRDGIWE
ncbi:MAG: SpoIIE family protein phosphatase [Blastocatellia bacterium]|nr:SpoIIE family protein phosphatase [Blastocatellia bacterium]